MGASANGGLDWNRLGKVVTPQGFAQPRPGSLSYYMGNPSTQAPTSQDPLMLTLMSLFGGTGQGPNGTGTTAGSKTGTG